MQEKAVPKASDPQIIISDIYIITNIKEEKYDQETSFTTF